MSLACCVVAVSLVGVLGTAIGVLLCLTGTSLVLLGACSAIEGTPKRGLLGALAGAVLFLGGLVLTGFL